MPAAKLLTHSHTDDTASGAIRGPACCSMTLWQSLWRSWALNLLLTERSLRLLSRSPCYVLCHLLFERFLCCLSLFTHRLCSAGCVDFDIMVKSPITVLTTPWSIEGGWGGCNDATAATGSRRFKLLMKQNECWYEWLLDDHHLVFTRKESLSEVGLTEHTRVIAT